MEKNEVMEGVGSVALLPDGSISGHFIQLPNSLCYGLHGTVKIQLGFDGLLEIIRGCNWMHYAMGYEETGERRCHSESKSRNARIKGSWLQRVGRMRDCHLAVAGERRNAQGLGEMLGGNTVRISRLVSTTLRKKERDVIVECRGHDAARFQNIDHAHGWDEDVSGMVEQKHGKHKISVSFECETLKAGKTAEDHIKQFIPKVAGLDAVVNIGRMKIAGLDFDAED
ncbi:hypothetical protein Scep_022180 [Stephania cephalantha]|uniref:Uncharacterized protein n=1 Tax=Stephania cephalantha TaxID=152367 RepID=A0AAP0F4W5_9MAGN